MLKTAIVLVGCLTLRAMGDVYYVAPHGHDANPGTEGAPWASIQYAATVAQAGDLVLVAEGNYPERVSTTAGGSGPMPEERIRFRGTGHVTMQGWMIQHPFVRIEQFDITGHSGASTLDAYVAVNHGANYFEMTGCTVRDGIAVARSDMVFTPPNQISSDSGGFLAAGLFAGQTINILRATNISILNGGSYVIDSLTDSTLIVQGSSIQEDGPVPAYITGAANYAVYLAGNAHHGRIVSNLFSNLSFSTWMIRGSHHLLEGNVLERNNGWDLIFMMGSDHIIRGNHFRQNELASYSPSADIFDGWSTTPFERITFERNFVENFVGVINAQKPSSRTSGPLWIRNNVFIDIGRFSGRSANTTIENNTFLRVARNSNVAVARASHPLSFNTDDNATNTIIRNNIFVDCGEPRRSETEADVGWYEWSGPADTLDVGYNFAAGAPPAFAGKAGFDEGFPQFNGGDPGFVNINDPLGPDGLPFTEDDGLWLRPDSKLVGAGYGGIDVGAYNSTVVAPRLLINLVSAGTFRILWPATDTSFELQGSIGGTGEWHATFSPPVLVGDVQVSTNTVTHPVYFFRLSK